MLKRILKLYRYYFGYSPKDFGYDLPEIKRIFIGRCGGVAPHLYEDLNDKYALAHAHVCKDDKRKGIVCFRKESYVTGHNQEIMFHEYCHIIDPTVAMYGCIDKLAYTRYMGITDPHFQQLFHGISFQLRLQSFGYTGRTYTPVGDDV